jgi:hypothetical protein
MHLSNKLILPAFEMALLGATGAEGTEGVTASPARAERAQI